MSRYIDAEKLFNTVGSIKPKNAQQYDDIGNFMNMITETPTEEVTPIIYANILVDEDGNMECSNCGNSECWGNYCMNCGAKMGKSEEE